MTLWPFWFRFIDEQSPSRGSVEILEGFPRPVGAVVNLPLVFHRFHQCRHSPLAMLVCSNSSGVRYRSAECSLCRLYVCSRNSPMRLRASSRFR